MAWMAEGRDARVDPAVLLPQARSVLSMAANYWHPGDTGLPGGGRVSRYAWGRDYHKELGGRLSRLRRRLAAAFPGLGHWGGTDAVPIMEKVWAERAGLGWIWQEREPGDPALRNLGAPGDVARGPRARARRPPRGLLRLVQRLPRGLPHRRPRLAGGGRRQALPLLPLDRHRDAWPAKVAARASAWMYGCDVCQDVCPWSVKFAEPGWLGAFAPRPPVMTRRLADGSPRRRGLVRGHRRAAPCAGPGTRGWCATPVPPPVPPPPTPTSTRPWRAGWTTRIRRCGRWRAGLSAVGAPATPRIATATTRALPGDLVEAPAVAVEPALEVLDLGALGAGEGHRVVQPGAGALVARELAGALVLAGGGEKVTCHLRFAISLGSRSPVV